MSKMKQEARTHPRHRRHHLRLVVAAAVLTLTLVIGLNPRAARPAGAQSTTADFTSSTTVKSPVNWAEVVYVGIRIRNSGTTPISGVSVRDVLPNGFTYRSIGFDAPPDHGFVCTPTIGSANTTVDCTGGLVKPGYEYLLIIETQAPSTTIFVANYTTVNPGSLKDTDWVQVSKLRPNLTLSLSAPSLEFAGTPMSYTFSVRNVGEAAASGVEVLHQLPVDFLYLSETPSSGFTCTAPDVQRVVRCTGNLGTSAAATITFNGAARPSWETIWGSKLMRITGTVDPANEIAESNETDNTATATTRVT